MLIDRARILQLVPHQGAMCLLDAVESWDDSSIRARSGGHRDPRHPLRRDGRLAAIHLAEYGAQAMALHGGLVAARDGGRAAPGVLTALREVRLEVEWIDDLAADLEVSATRLMADGSGSIYAFEVHAGGRRLAAGRVSVHAVRPEILWSDVKSEHGREPD